MRRSAYLIALTTWVLTIPASLAYGEKTLQQKYLDVYLEINDAEHLEKQGDFRGALNDFQECYNNLAKIHDSDPNWESALVAHRMDDCEAKIRDLTPKAAAQVAAPAPPVVVAPADNTYNSALPPAVATQPAPDSAEVASLKMQLEAVKEELNITKQKLADSQAQLETYRTQLETVNSQLAALKNAQSVDDRMGKLLSDNKVLTDKLATAQKELDTIKSNPKSKLAMAQAQLKNLQDQYAATQEDNKALRDTTTNLKQQLDQAQTDLVAANQKLAAAGTASPEYATLKRENEIMRDILTRELQEQAHRDMAKRLAQEEFDNLKLKSKVLQEQLDILGSPMTPPTNDEERAILASLKVPGPDVAAEPPPTTPTNGFSANVTGAQPAADPTTSPATTTPPAVDPSATTTAPATPAAPTNVATTTPPAPTAPATPDVTTTADAGNGPPVSIVMNNATSGGDSTTPAAPATAPTPSAPPATTAPDPATTTTPASPTPAVPTTPPTVGAASTDPTTSTTPTTSTPPATPTTAPSTPAPDPTAPLPPTTPAGPSSVTVGPTSTTPPPAPPPPAPTTPQPPDAGTTVTTTTVDNGGGDNTQTKQDDPTQYSTKARLPDDMRETAQDAADLFKNQKYDESAAKYQSIIDKYPESLYAWSNLGVVRFQQGKFDDALKALQQAVKLSPTDAFSYSNLGIVYYQLNQYENAIDALNSAKALDPNDAKTHNYLGCACSQKGWQEVAEKEFRKAIEIDPNFGDAHFNLALVYATSKPPSLELARREYNRALELGIAKDQRLEKLLGGASTADLQQTP